MFATRCYAQRDVQLGEKPIAALPLRQNHARKQRQFGVLRDQSHHTWSAHRSLDHHNCAKVFLEVAREDANLA